MNKLFPIIVIIFALVRFLSRMAKVKSDRPGQQNAAPPAGGPVQPRPTQPRQTIATPPGPVQPAQPRPVYEPAQPAAEQPATYGGLLDESDRARDDLAEGDSRECDHGSVGGSMDITTHMGAGEEFEHARQQVQTRVKVNVKPSREAADEAKAASRAIPELSPEEMRRAIVMAEILKRPAERRAGRRWAAR